MSLFLFSISHPESMKKPPEGMHKKLACTTILFFLIFAVHSLGLAITNNKIPTSRRAQKAIAKVESVLKDELAQMNLKYGNPIFIRIFKQEKELEVWVQDNDSFRLFKSYPICTYGFRGLGPKLKQGDWRAPEGFYFVPPSSLNPSSKYHLSFNLGYPNQYDRVHNRTGSALMVHGNCVSVGCYAMTDKRIEEIYALADAALRNGQPFFRVHIFPFKMTDNNIRKHKKTKWYPFWLNLKQGYDYFENNGHVPPDVSVKNKKYSFKKP